MSCHYRQRYIAAVLTYLALVSRQEGPQSMVQNLISTKAGQLGGRNL
jgi:hypothetical protein